MSINHTRLDHLMRYAKFLGYGDVYIKIDKETGLHAIIALHNLKLGPAIGGCRMMAYESNNDALEDVLRLGYMMSYKAAINNLPHGGGKAVILKPPVIKDKKAFFEKFAEFVAELNGRYITAVDSGTNPEDMDIIAKITPYVTCTSDTKGAKDPSPLTALGVRRAIQAAVKFKLNKDSLEGIHVTIQGAGNVGYALAKELHALGARLTMSDIDSVAANRCAQEFNAHIVAPNEIYSVKADVFSPCALGATLNLKTINQLNVPIIAGSANNQLAHHRHGQLLHEKNILYAPDFLINAGGLIHVAVAYAKGDMQKSIEQIENIYHSVYDIFEKSAKENLATSKIAERIARDRLK